MRLAIIPARGGSKRIPRKNVRPFCGRPMIAWPIDTAHAANCFDRIVVSTDDAEIADIARAAGAEVPFLRPAELANDVATTRDVLVHAIHWMRDNATMPNAIACIYPTAPLLQPEDIRAGAEYLDAADIDYAVTVTPFEFPIQRAVRLRQGMRLEMMRPEHAETRSQDLEPAYHDAGALYWGRPEAFLSGAPFFGARTRAIVLPRQRAIDIDTPADWLVAEAMFRAFRGAS